MNLYQKFIQVLTTGAGLSLQEMNRQDSNFKAMNTKGGPLLKEEKNIGLSLQERNIEVTSNWKLWSSFYFNTCTEHG